MSLITITLQPDETSAYDAIMKSGQPNMNYDVSAIIVGDPVSDKDVAWRGLIKFTLPPELDGTYIAGASLYLYEYDAYFGNGTGCSVYLNRVLRDWVENQVTWNKYIFTTTWTSAGCSSDGNDRIATASSSLNRSWTPANDFVEFSGLTADIQGFIDSTFPNYGWLINAPDAETCGPALRRYYSYYGSSYATAAYRPKLVISYSETPINRVSNINGMIFPTSINGITTATMNGVS